MKNVLFCIAIVKVVFTQEMDFSGVNQFWIIQEKLTNQRTVSEAEWQRLLMSPGYLALDKKERKGPILRRAIELAYSPDLGSELRQALDKGGFLAYSMRHLQRVPKLRDQLEQFRSELSKPGFLNQSFDKLKLLIPAELIAKYPPCPIAFVFFAPDGRGYPQIIVADLLNVMNSISQSGFFAHEYFHFYRSRLGQIKDVDFDPVDESLMYALIRIEEEGIADQLDKTEIPGITEAEIKSLVTDESKAEFYLSYRQFYKDSETWLRRINSDLEKMADEPDSAKGIADQLNKDLPIGGRPVGAFMARQIIERLGIASLRSCIGDTFKFFELFNQSNPESFSKKSITLLEQLQKKYHK
ncbi:MAG: hypothetical protein KDD94_03635 [Calditrichaeota bacterium]|nr:hypothetical protein [Calditrichota bacterium]